MSIYQKLTYTPPKLEIKKDAKQIIFEMVSCMCDNRSLLTLKQNTDGEFKLNSPPRNGGYGQSLSNFQFKFATYEIEWEADEQHWDKVFEMINSGTEVIESVKSR